MKKSISILLSTFKILSLLTLQGTAQDKSSKSKKATKEAASSSRSSWIEMDSFKQLFNSTVIAAQAGDFGPVREKANDLMVQSVLLAKSDYPDVHDNVELRTLLGAFTDNCEELQRFIDAGRSNEEVLVELNRMNAAFSEINQLMQTQLTEK